AGGSRKGRCYLPALSLQSLPPPLPSPASAPEAPTLCPGITSFLLSPGENLCVNTAEEVAGAICLPCGPVTVSLTSEKSELEELTLAYRHRDEQLGELVVCANRHTRLHAQKMPTLAIHPAATMLRPLTAAEPGSVFSSSFASPASGNKGPDALSVLDEAQGSPNTIGNLISRELLHNFWNPGKAESTAKGQRKANLAGSPDSVSLRDVIAAREQSSSQIGLQTTQPLPGV
ncbi:hypothetical protein STEG23_010013, partial [Scotinomys teguina]